jgi:tetratricopeptide (TPR) repeat protein
MIMNSSFKPVQLFILLLVSFSFSSLYAQNKSDANYKHCGVLITKGTKAIDSGNLSKALEYYTKAEVIAKKNHHPDSLNIIYTDIGRIYTRWSNYGEALGYFQKAYNLSEKLGSQKNIAKALTNIGILYARENDNQGAINYFKRAYKLSAGNDASFIKVMTAINMSDAYNTLGNFKEARRYLDDVKSLPKTEKAQQLWILNYASSYYVEGRTDKALQIIQDVSKDIDRKKEAVCYTCLSALLCKIYTKQGNPALAIEFANKGLRNTPQMPDRIELYNQLSDLYLKRREVDIAFKYKDSVIIAKDSLSTLINRGLYESNKVKLKIQEYQSQLQTNTEKQKAQLSFFIVTIILCLIILIALYKVLKGKIARQNQEKLIIQRNQEIVNLELEKKNKEHLLTEKELETIKNTALLQQEQLKNKISEKNRELSAKALYLSIRNELIESSINALSAIPEVAKSPSVANHIKVLQKHLQSDTGWEEFINHFEKINPAFLKVLKEKHPHLNGKDIRFVCCVFMNLDIKEIANIFNITYNAANKRKQRIKEKMDIDEVSSLYEYLLKLDSTISKTIIAGETE